MTLGRLRLALWVMVAIAAVGILFLALRPPSNQPIDRSIASIGGPFTLTDADGQSFASSRLTGKPAAIFFGFTHCPDVCPTTLARLTKLRRQLGKGDEALSVVFITVDPERDTPAELKTYASMFDSPVISLTGSVADIERVKKVYGVFSQKAPQPGGGYSVDHTATVFLMDRDGHFSATLSPEEKEATALDKLKRLAA
jgi:protein SCO1/2